MDEDPVEARVALELEELRLRIRDLRAPWWRRPAVTAPLATVVAASLGLFWGVASGFFDVSRRELMVTKRELELENRDLKANRDAQSRNFLPQPRGNALRSRNSSSKRPTSKRRLSSLISPW